MLYSKLIFVFILFLSFPLLEDRYLDPIFSEVDIENNVVYGNSPDLPFLFWVESNTQDIDLDMDIYQPSGDTEELRPLLLLMHSGSFFTGSKNADDMVALAIESAQRGYVVASLSYRLGLNILSSYSGERAVYRSVQDASAAIRYFRENSEAYNIDPDAIFIWGSSAGSFSAINLAYLDDSERPESTYGSGNDPDLGCVDCAGNDFDHSNKPNAIVSCWGAISNLDYIDSDDVTPIAMFHGTLDPIVPFTSGYPFTVDIALPFVYGSELMHQKFQENGIYSEFYIGENELHEYWGTLNGSWLLGPNDNWDFILNKGYEFLYQYINFGSDIQGDLNQDSVVDVLDIIIVVNHILDDNFIEQGDVNSDGFLNILDIILYINIITLD
jgi:acetyl esterase/lipase